MSRTPTTEDANLILRLYEARREPRLREAREWFARGFSAQTLAEYDQQCPRGSQENASFRMVTTYWEMVASFITSEVLHRELFFDSGQELLLTWMKIRAFIPAWRERSANPMAFRNLEKVANAYVDWYEARAPEFPERFAANVATMAPRSPGE